MQNKFFTLSYDDGITQDKRLVKIFNKYGIRATFNINSELLGNPGYLRREDMWISHNKIEPREVAELYRGHEVAAHTLTHPFLPELDDEEIIRQIEEDRKNLEKLLGKDIVGLAYPGGGIGGVNTNEHIISLIRKNSKIKYARTTICNGSFDTQDNLLELHPNVKFEAIPAGWDGYFDKLSTQAASGSMPDIVQMDYLYLTTYANNNSIADLQPYVDDGTIDVSQIADNVVDAGKVDKKLAGIVGGTGTVAIGYNPEVFKEAGIEEPNQDGSAWTWDEFVETAKTIKEKTGKYGICSGVADDTNIFNYWVRSHGEQLFSDDNKSLGYDDDQILVDYLDMWKDLMDCDAEPDPDEYTQIQSLGQEAGPVVTGDAAMLNENNNYASKMSSANPNLKVTIPPVSDINKKAIWNKPSYMLCISEKSKVKKEAAEFINWFINSEESNDIMMAERGVPSPQNIRDHLLDSGKLNEKQQEMFEYADQVVEYTGDTPDPDPMGISEVSKSLQDCAYSAFYGNITTKEAAEKFRKEANEILERNN